MTNLAIQEKEKFTVKDLIELLSSLEEDREVLLEANKGELFCMIDTSPKKKRRGGRPKKIIIHIFILSLRTYRIFENFFEILLFHRYSNLYYLCNKINDNRG